MISAQRQRSTNNQKISRPLQGPEIPSRWNSLTPNWLHSFVISAVSCPTPRFSPPPCAAPSTDPNCAGSVVTHHLPLFPSELSSLQLSVT